MLKRNFISIGLLSLLVIFALANPGVSQQSEKSADVKKSTEAERATEAADVLTQIMNIPENAIPDELMARAHGIAVIPHVVKGAFGFGGQWGKGLMSSLLDVRLRDKSADSYSLCGNRNKFGGNLHALLQLQILYGNVGDEHVRFTILQNVGQFPIEKLQLPVVAVVLNFNQNHRTSL